MMGGAWKNISFGEGPWPASCRAAPAIDAAYTYNVNFILANLLLCYSRYDCASLSDARLDTRAWNQTRRVWLCMESNLTPRVWLRSDAALSMNFLAGQVVKWHL